MVFWSSVYWSLCFISVFTSRKKSLGCLLYFSAKFLSEFLLLYKLLYIFHLGFRLFFRFLCNISLCHQNINAILAPPFLLWILLYLTARDGVVSSLINGYSYGVKLMHRVKRLRLKLGERNSDVCYIIIQSTPCLVTVDHSELCLQSILVDQAVVLLFRSWLVESSSKFGVLC